MKMLLVGGARPNFMKLAPLLRAIQDHNDSSTSQPIQAVLAHTGQHYDYRMSKVFFDDLGLPEPDAYLRVGAGSHAEQTGNAMIRLEGVMVDQSPDIVIVVGDVNSTLAGALAAVKLNIPIAHVEAGLRSFDRTMPEEINRLLTDAISDYLFVPSDDALENLRREGIPDSKVFMVGDIMVDSLMFGRAKAKLSPILERLGLKQREFALLTLHRPATVDNREVLAPIIDTLVALGRQLPILFVAHPRTSGNLTKFGLDNKMINLQGRVDGPGVYLIEPLGYLDFLRLISVARFVLTDSGSLQQETTVLGVQCLTLRTTTERPITISHGTNVLTGVDPKRIFQAAMDALHSEAKKQSIPPLWDGHTAERIIRVLANETAI